MAVRFKFRSSVNFDSVDLGGRSSISVHDLRVRIAELKKLKVCADFRLVLSDADSGQAFEDEDSQIPAGSSVIIKRVPTEREEANDRGVISCAVGKAKGSVGRLPFSASTSENFGINNFDDFGVDLYPNPDTQIHCYADDMNLPTSTANMTKGVSIRFLEASNHKDKKIEKSNASESLSNKVTGENFKGGSDEVGNQKEMTFRNNAGQKMKLLEDLHIQLMYNADLPAELRCSLCNSIFKEAVMIPCCQHSFCNNCIALTLVKQSSCPKCSSTKCTVKDLLPNLSLRQAIEHFLEAQNTINNTSHNNLPMDAPDGESGIQAKDISCAVSIRQQEPACSPSSATGMGSNHVISETACESNFPFKRKEALSIEARGGGVAIPPGIHRKYVRNCYMCGSPDHLIRECPQAKTGNAVASGGLRPYRDSYWHGASFPNIRPYANIYGTTAMMPYDPMMFQVPTFGISSCMPPMYNPLSTPFGFMGMSAFPRAMMPGAEPGTHSSETTNKQNCERNLKYEHQERYHGSDLSDDYHSGGTGKSHAKIIQSDKRPVSDNEGQKAHGKLSHHEHISPRQRHSFQAETFHTVDEKHKDPHMLADGRDHRTHCSEKSKSDLQDLSNDSRRRSGDRESHQDKFSKYSASDCSWKSHHRSRISEDDEFPTHRKSHCYKETSQSESCLEHESSSIDRRKFHRERDASHSSRHSSKTVKPGDERLDRDMREGWEKRGRDQGHQKYRRTH